MFHPQPLHLLPGLGIIDEALQKLHPSGLAAGLLLNAGSALAKGGQVVFRPQPLHQLPKLPCHVCPACARGLPREANLKLLLAGASFLTRRSRDESAITAQDNSFSPTLFRFLTYLSFWCRPVE